MFGAMQIGGKTLVAVQLGLSLALIVSINGCATRPPAVETVAASESNQPATSAVAEQTAQPAPTAAAPAAPQKSYDELWIDDMIAQHMGATRAVSMMVGDARHGELDAFTRQS